MLAVEAPALQQRKLIKPKCVVNFLNCFGIICILRCPFRGKIIRILRCLKVTWKCFLYYPFKLIIDSCKKMPLKATGSSIFFFLSFYYLCFKAIFSTSCATFSVLCSLALNKKVIVFILQDNIKFEKLFTTKNLNDDKYLFFFNFTTQVSF